MPWMVKLRGGAGRIRDGVGFDAPMRVLAAEESVKFDNRPPDDANLIIEACEDFEITISPPMLELVEPVVIDVPPPEPPKPKRRRRKKAST